MTVIGAQRGLILDFLRKHDAFAGGRCKRCGFWLDDDTQTFNPVTGRFQGTQSNPGRGVQIVENALTATVIVSCLGCRASLAITHEQLDDFGWLQGLAATPVWISPGNCVHCGRGVKTGALICGKCGDVTREFGDIIEVRKNVPLFGS